MLATLSEFFREFVRFTLARKKYWMFPVITAVVLVGALVLFSEGSVIAPFIYALF